MTGANVPASLDEAIEVCPFRTIFGPPDAPIRGVWAIIAGAALPVPAEILAELREVLGGGGAFMVLAKDRAERDAAKQELLMRFAPPRGAA